MDDTVTSAFFRALAGRFADNGPRGPGAVGVLVLAGIVVGFILAGMVRRLLARRAALSAFVEHHGLAPEDLAFVRALARDASARPLEVLTHLDLFERTTRRALAAAKAASPGDPAERIARLRHALGFDRLPAHTPLLSTRELAPGTAVELERGGLRRGVVLAVDERALRVELDGALDLQPGAELELGIVHAREARYAARGSIAWIRPAPLETTHLALSHDEAPRRIQRREHVRVRVEGPASLRPLRWPGVAPARPPGPPRAIAAQLLDVSAGGLRVLTSEPLPVGVLVAASFAVGGERFEALAAVVLSAVGAAGGLRELHLELSNVSAPDRERLAGALIRAETHAGGVAALP